VTSNLDIFSFGLNNKGQLGISDEVPFVYNPVKIANFTSFKITEIKCGDEMSVFLNSNGDLFSCGWLSGIDQNFDSYLPTKIDV